MSDRPHADVDQYIEQAARELQLKHTVTHARVVKAGGETITIKVGSDYRAVMSRLTILRDRALVAAGSTGGGSGII